MKPRLLILSFVPIDGDPRVMKQVRRFVDEYDVTTCSPGPPPHARVTHLTMEGGYVGRRSLPSRLIELVARPAERFRWLYFRTPVAQQVEELLGGQEFEAVIANDADPVGIACRLFGPHRVHADLHEFFPDMGFAKSRLGRRQQRYYKWMTRSLISQAASSTTVGAEIARRYREYGLDPQVVTNATHLRDLVPSPVGRPIRLVYSGNPFVVWGLPEIMRAVAAARSDVTLDLFLTRYIPVDRAQVEQLATELGDRITVREPVPQSELVETLNAYDVGIFVLPPLSPNSELALPNKFFDYVQARLALLVGPSVEMARIVRERGLGLVTSDFTDSSIVEAIDALDADSVQAFKAASDTAASDLASERQVEVWADAVSAIVGGTADAR